MTATKPASEAAKRSAKRIWDELDMLASVNVEAKIAAIIDEELKQEKSQGEREE